MPDDDIVDQTWQTYRTRVVPATATADQLEFARMTFFAGALVMFEIMAELSDQPVDAADLVLQAIDNELTDFETVLDRKVAGLP